MAKPHRKYSRIPKEYVEANNPIAADDTDEQRLDYYDVRWEELKSWLIERKKDTEPGQYVLEVVYDKMKSLEQSSGTSGDFMETLIKGGDKLNTLKTERENAKSDVSLEHITKAYVNLYRFVDQLLAELPRWQLTDFHRNMYNHREIFYCRFTTDVKLNDLRHQLNKVKAEDEQ